MRLIRVDRLWHLLGAARPTFGSIDLGQSSREAAAKRVSVTIRFLKQVTQFRFFLHHSLCIHPPFFGNVEIREAAKHSRR